MTGLLTLGHRPRRVTAPFAPAARIQRRAAQTRDFHGDDVGYGADAAAAVVHHGRRVATGEQGFKLGAQLSSWLNLPLASRFRLKARFRAPGMWPATGSSGSTSPRKRGAPRASRRVCVGRPNCFATVSVVTSAVLAGARA